MWFKNLQLFALDAPLDLEAIHERPLQPCGSQTMETRGWVSPTHDGTLVYECNGFRILGYGTESRILPSAVIQEEVARRVADLNFKPGRKQRREIKDAVVQDLLPKAFTRRKMIRVWITDNWIGIDTPSQSRAEDVIELLRQTLPTFPVRLCQTELSPAWAMRSWLMDGAVRSWRMDGAMRSWLMDGAVPGGFTIDQDCTVRSVTESRKEVAYKRGLDDEQIRDHLSRGCMPVKLAMTYADRVSFVLTEKFEIKRLEFLDLVTSKLEDEEDLMDATLAIMDGELTALASALVEALGGLRYEF